MFEIEDFRRRKSSTSNILTLHFPYIGESKQHQSAYSCHDRQSDMTISASQLPISSKRNIRFCMLQLKIAISWNYLRLCCRYTEFFGCLSASVYGTLQLGFPSPVSANCWATLLAVLVINIDRLNLQWANFSIVNTSSLAGKRSART